MPPLDVDADSTMGTWVVSAAAPTPAKGRSAATHRGTVTYAAKLYDHANRAPCLLLLMFSFPTKIGFNGISLRTIALGVFIQRSLPTILFGTIRG